jgi:hypothetical protein
MLLVLPQQSVTPSADWTTAAIHDTVAAIVRQGGYAQSAAQSLFGRFIAFVTRQLTALYRYFHNTPHARPIVIALVALIVLVVLIRIAVTSSAAEQRLRAERARAGRKASIDPLARAHELAASGQHTEAAHALYVAVIQRMAAHGWIRLHSSKTGGDYARELRVHGVPGHAAFRAFNARFDELIYGAGVCNADEFDELLRRASSLLAEARAA